MVRPNFHTDACDPTAEASAEAFSFHKTMLEWAITSTANYIILIHPTLYFHVVKLHYTNQSYLIFSCCYAQLGRHRGRNHEHYLLFDEPTSTIFSKHICMQENASNHKIKWSVRDHWNIEETCLQHFKKLIEYIRNITIAAVWNTSTEQSNESSQPLWSDASLDRLRNEGKQDNTVQVEMNT
jgi:hypothetical protein